MVKFELCWCGKHGRIIINNRPGVEFASIETVFGLMQFYLLSGRVSPEDGKTLHKQIINSGLPVKQEDVSKEIDDIITPWNHSRHDLILNNKPDDEYFDLEKLHPNPTT